MGTLDLYKKKKKKKVLRSRKTSFVYCRPSLIAEKETKDTATGKDATENNAAR